MEFDSTKSFGEIHKFDGSAFSEQVLEISRHIIPQENTRKWARNLRFLSPATRPQAVSPTGEAACLCESWPVFQPTDVQRESLFLTDTADLPDCTHYVAVSYCWKSQKEDKDENKSFRIQTLDDFHDGTAPRDIVMRAIKFAAHRKARFIWIDQECIRQNDREDKELGIQSMDLVYSRASFPLALMDTVFDSVKHILAIKQAIARFQIYLQQLHQPPVSESEILNVASAIQLLGQDRWLTRAWILQETILSGLKMEFLCRCSIDPPSDAFQGPPGEILLSMGHMRELHGSIEVYSQLASTVRRNDDDPNKLLRQFLASSNGPATRLTIGERRWSHQSHAFNAVAAFNLLEGYKNSRVADRLAIIANLCDYQTRLDTTKLTSMRFGFSTCLLTLALINGDISLLQFWSELNLDTLPYNLKRYRIKETIKPSGDLLNFPSSWNTFSWSPASGTCLSPDNEYCLDVVGVEERAVNAEDEDITLDIDPGLKLRIFHGPAIRVAGTRLTRDGLQLDGWLWTVEQSIDLSFMRDALLESWKLHEASYDRSQGGLSDWPTPDDLSRWPHCVDMLLHLLQWVVGTDVGELLWRRAARGAPGLLRLDDYGIMDANTPLTEFIDPVTGRYIGDTKWPNCTEASFRRILWDSICHDTSPWRWIVPLVVKTGTLQVWRIRYLNFNAVSYQSCAVFDCFSASERFQSHSSNKESEERDMNDLSEHGNNCKGGSPPSGKPEEDLDERRPVRLPQRSYPELCRTEAILLPRLRFIEASVTYPVFKFRQHPSAWATMPIKTFQGEQDFERDNFIPILRGQGMIRGLWKINQAVWSSYILS